MMMEPINCRTVQAGLWEFVSGRLSAEVREAFGQHLASCGDCAARRTEIRSMRTTLKSLPAKVTTPMLQTKLRVVASRERARRVRRIDWAARMKNFREDLKLVFDNAIRPLAMPAMGGVLASCLCFGMLVDKLHMHPTAGNDVPVALFSQAAMENPSPFTVGGRDVMVMLNLDENGKVTDFTVPEGTATPDELNQIGNLVLYSTFVPARAFGQRVSSKVLVSIQHMNIRADLPSP